MPFWAKLKLTQYRERARERERENWSEEKREREGWKERESARCWWYLLEHHGDPWMTEECERVRTEGGRGGTDQERMWRPVVVAGAP